MSQRSNTIKVVGLYTFLSELQAPEGSLVKADNVNIDETGVITPRRGFADYSELPDSEQRVKQILNYKKRILRHYNGSLEYDNGNGIFTSFLGQVNEVEPGFRIKSEEVNGNLYFTSSDGIKKLSASSNSDFPNINITDAGVPKAVDLSVKPVPSSTGFLPPQSKVGYKILYGYKDLNNVLVLGSPTSITIATNNSNKTVIPEQFKITFNITTAENDLIDGYSEVSGSENAGTGKYFVISTLNTDYYIWFNLSDAADGLSTEQPQDSTTFGKVGIQINVSKSDDSAKVVAKTANTLDNELKNFYDISIDADNNAIVFTSKEEGDIKSALPLETLITVDIIQEGKLITGDFANCEIETVIPDSIDKNKLPYFIQVYRTQVITANEFLGLDDISPGEECNLVYEAPIDLEPRSIFKYTDDITEDFRDRGTPLYNNPFSGEGLINSNERPPIAKDIEIYNNYTFYANTKTFHRSQFRFISVDDFKNEETFLYIGNEDILRQYTFRGVQEVTEITCGTVADTKENTIEENEISFTNYNSLLSNEVKSLDNTAINGGEVKIKGNYAIQSVSGVIYLYKIENNQLILLDSLDDSHDYCDIAGNYIVSVFQDNTIKLYKINDQAPIIELKDTEIVTGTHNFSKCKAEVSNSGTYIVAYDSIDQVLYTFAVNSINDTLVQAHTINSTTDNFDINSYQSGYIIVQLLNDDISYYDLNSGSFIIELNIAYDNITDLYSQGIYIVLPNSESSGSTGAIANAGSVDVYKLAEGILSKIDTIYCPLEEINNQFGYLTSLSNNKLIIGSRLGTNIKRLYFYEITENDKINLIKIEDPSLLGLGFGFYSIDADENKVLASTSTGAFLYEINPVLSATESTEQDPAYVQLNSRENEKQYHIWYNAGNGTNPSNVEQELQNIQEISATNLFQLQNHGLVNNDIVDYKEEEYFVINSNLDDFQLSKEIAGSAINIETKDIVTIIKKEVSDNSISIPISTIVGESPSDILVKTESKISELEDFNTETITSIFEIFCTSFTNIFQKEQHRLLTGNIVEYNLKQYTVFVIDEDNFYLYEEVSKKILDVEDNLFTATTDSATDVFTKNDHGLENGDSVRYLSNNYYVMNASQDTFQLSVTKENPVAIDVTSTGSTDITINLQDQQMTIINPFRLIISNSNAGFSDGVVLYNQENLEVQNIQDGESCYINIYSAEDEIRYYIWFNKGSNIDPSIKNASGIEVDLNGINSTENVADYLRIALLDNPDFDASRIGSVVTITNTENGNSTNCNTPNNNPVTDIGNNWVISTKKEGLGEDASQNYCKWSINPSISISIEQTARSFVKVVNRDPNSPVNAFYLSGEQDIPGLILLENRNLEDKPFYVGVNNEGIIGRDISSEFDPPIPYVEVEYSQNKIFNSNGNFLITYNNHGLSQGDEIYFLVTGDQISDPNQVSGVFTVNSVINENQFSIPNVNNIVITSTENTEFYFYKTEQFSDNDEKSNRIYYSKLLQPEAVPIGNYLDVGSKDQPIERILALRDTLFVFKTDGVYMITGFGAPFSLRLLDNSSNIIAPDSATILNNQIYVLTDDGVAVITESGTSIISRPIEDKILDVTGQNFDYRLKTFATSYDNDKSYIIWLPTTSEDEYATQAYRYNFYERTWTRWTVPATCARVSANSVLYIGSGDRAVLQKERKNRTRTDYSDRNFTRQIPVLSINDNKIQMSSYTDIEIGDVLVQDQYVTIDVYNNMLLKLDLDPGTKTASSFFGNVNGISTNVELIAKTKGYIGNDILIKTDGVKTLNELVEDWNSENKKNQVLLLSSNGNEIPNSLIEIKLTGGLGGDYEDTLKCVSGDNISTKLQQLQTKLNEDGVTSIVLNWIPSFEDLSTKTFAEYIRDEFNLLIDDINSSTSNTQYKNYQKVNILNSYESIISDKNTIRPDLNQVTVAIEPRFFEGDVEVYKAIKSEVQWSPLHFGDPSALKQFSKGTVIVDQNNFTKATVSYSSDLSQGFVDIEKNGKGAGYYASSTYGNANLYWGGDGNDVPLLNVIPREKQRGRYLNVKFQHAVAREDYRVLGVTTVVRAISDRGYR